MSVCSQMGNGQGKGGKKKTKNLVKEGTQLDEDSPSRPEEMENSDLQQEGLDLFEKDRSRRRDVLKDLVNQSGTYSHEGGDGNLHASSQNGERNISDDNHSSSIEVRQGDGRSTVQVGKDPIGVFVDSRLANGHVTGDVSGKNCGESVLINPGLSPSNHPRVTPGTDIPDGAFGRGPVDVPNSAHGNAPGDVPSNVPGGTTQGTPEDLLVGAFANVTINGPGSVAGSAPSGSLCDIRSDISGNGFADVPVEPSGSISVPAPSSLFPNPPPSCPDQVDSAQKKMPTEGDGTSIYLEQSRSGKAPPQEQNDYQSFPPTPQSEIESKTPSVMQFVPGIHGGTKSSKGNDSENLKGENHRVSSKEQKNKIIGDEFY